MEKFYTAWCARQMYHQQMLNNNVGRLFSCVQSIPVRFSQAQSEQHGLNANEPKGKDMTAVKKCVS